MFREIREIKEEKDEKELGYLKIRPNKTLSMAEVNAFWDDVFTKAALEASKS